MVPTFHQTHLDPADTRYPPEDPAELERLRDAVPPYSSGQKHVIVAPAYGTILRGGAATLEGVSLRSSGTFVRRNRRTGRAIHRACPLRLPARHFFAPQPPLRPATGKSSSSGRITPSTPRFTLRKYGRICPSFIGRHTTKHCWIRKKANGSRWRGRRSAVEVSGRSKPCCGKVGFLKRVMLGTPALSA